MVYIRQSQLPKLQEYKYSGMSILLPFFTTDLEVDWTRR